MTPRAWMSIALALASVACTVADDREGPSPTRYPGYAFTATNAADGNAVWRYGRTADGRLRLLGAVETGGNGTGSQMDPSFGNDSVVLSPLRDRLFVVNGGTDSITAFQVDEVGTLTRVGTYSSNGRMPTSVTTDGNRLYVSHAMARDDGGGQIVGFRVGPDGALSPIDGADYAASAPTPITHVLLSPSGRALIAIESSTGLIDVYRVYDDGTLSTPVRTPSAAPSPFGAAFASDAILLVADGDAQAGSVSSYRVGTDRSLTAISAGVANGGDAACSLALTPDHAIVLASHASSGDVSSYRLESDGTLTLLASSLAQRASGAAASGPGDSFVTSDGHFFYRANRGLDVIGAYAIASDGTLTEVGNGDGDLGLPMLGAEGLAGF